MFKKLLILGGGAVLLLALLFGRDATSYVTASWDKVQQTVRDSVPVEMEIDRARTMIRGLEPEIRDHRRQIAREELEVERLRGQLGTAEGQLAVARQHIFRLKNDLENGSGSFVYAGRHFTEEQVRTDLENRFERFQVQEQTVDKLRQVLRARERGLEAAVAQLAEMQAAKEQLVVEVADLEARMKMLDVARTSSELNIDDSRLARTRDLIRDINVRLDVEDRMLGTSSRGFEGIPLEEEERATRDILEEITEHFDGPSDPDAIVIN